MPPSFPDRADGTYSSALVAANGLGSYAGGVMHRQMNGAGTLTCPCGSFSGTFLDDALEREGTYTSAAGGGSSSSSSAAAVHPSLATPILATVRNYSGGFHRTRFAGTGCINFANGDAYQGPCADGLPDGEDGKYTYSDGRVYHGALRRGARHGHGRLTQSSGDYYDGEFIDGHMTGFGIASYANGARLFTGLWDDGAKVKGRLSFQGSERMYEGQWADERPHGKGAMVFANGDRYEGDFDKGMLNGVGLLTYADQPGRRFYYGQFFQDQPCGHGQLISYPPDSRGAAAPITPGTETVVEGYFMNGALVPPTDTNTVEHVLVTTQGLPQPLSRPPFIEMELNHQALNSAERLIIPDAASVSNSRNNSLCGDGAAQLLRDCELGIVLDGQRAAEPRPSVEPLDEDIILSDDDASLDESEGSDDGARAGGGLPPGVIGISSPDSSSCRGWLEKCSIGRSTLGLVSNWKRRFFVLACFEGSVCLGYYADDLCRKPIGFLRLHMEDTRIVTRPSTRTHKKASKPGRELCVIYHEKNKTYKLLLRTDDAANHGRWVAAFLRYFTIVDRPSDHPLPCLAGGR